MWNAELDESQAWVKIAGRNINNLRYAIDTTLMVEGEEGLKGLLMKVKEKSERVGLKLIIQKTKIMASSPITSWQIEREKKETRAYFIFFDSTITSDCSHEIKMLTAWREGYDKPRQHIKMQRCHFTNKVLSSQSYDFSSSHIWMWELDNKDSWEIKNWCSQHCLS